MQIVNRNKPKKRQNGRQSKYDICFRRRVAREYAEGDRSMTQIAVQYGISKYNVKDWVNKFCCDLAAKEQDIIIMTPEQQQELEQLKKQNAVLQKKLDFEQMRNFALETMIDLAKEELGVDIRKNSGAKQPGE
jgi:transposase